MLSLVCLLTAACDDLREASPPSTPFDVAQEAAEPMPVGYPSGPWWRGDISGVVVGVAHILIAHRESSTQHDQLRRLGPAPARTKQAALELAQGLAARARQAPETFESLANQYSEDPTTRARGGRMGAVQVMQLPPSMTDALGNMRTGQTSRVVETRLGFHVIKRLPVAAHQVVAGQEVQIHHLDSMVPTAPERNRNRSRERARALATEAQRLLRTGGLSFDALVERYSDSWSRFNGGKLGDLSSYGDTFDPVGANTLADLAIGGVSDVVEDARGFRIFRRTAPDSELSAMTGFIIGFEVPREPWVAERVTRSRAKAEALAKQALRHLLIHPEDFDDYRRRHCDYGFCEAPPYSEPPGRIDSDNFARLARTTSIGALIAEPVRLPHGFLIARMEDPQRFVPKERTYLFEMPRPAPVTLTTARASELVWFGNQLARAAGQTLGLSHPARTRLEEDIRTTFGALGEAEGDDRIDQLGAFFTQLEAREGMRVAGQLSALFDELSVRVQGVTVDDRSL